MKRVYAYPGYRFLIKILISLGVIFFSQSVSAQLKSLKIANTYFENGQFAEAVHAYHKALKKNQRWHKKDEYTHFLILFQLAESKRLNHDSDYKEIYYRILNKSIRSSIDLNDPRIGLILAETFKNVGLYYAAVDEFQRVFEKCDSFPDEYKMSFAYCSLKENEFKQVLELLNEINDSSRFEPLFSEFKNYCNKELEKNISNTLALNDTLFLSMEYIGCFGGTFYQFAFVKLDTGYLAITYSQNSYKIQKIDSISTQYISDSQFSKVIDFEYELRNIDPKNQRSSCTLSGEYIFIVGRERFKKSIHGCALGYGHTLIDMLIHR